MQEKEEDGYQINNSFIGKTYYNSSVKQDNGDITEVCFIFNLHLLLPFHNGLIVNTIHKHGTTLCGPYIYSKRYTNEGSLWYNNRWYYYNLNCNNGKVYRNSIYLHL